MRENALRASQEKRQVYQLCATDHISLHERICVFHAVTIYSANTVKQSSGLTLRLRSGTYYHLHYRR